MIAGVGMSILGAGLTSVAEGLSGITLESIASLFLLGAAMIFLGYMIPFALMASISLLILTAALIPFGVASMIAGIGMTMLGSGLQSVSEGLSGISLDSIAGLFLLGVAMIFLGSMLPFALLAGVTLSVLTAVLIPFGVAAMIAGFGMQMLADGFVLMAGAVGGIVEMMSGLISNFVQLAMVAPGLFVAAAGIVAIGIALLALAAGQLVAGLASLFSFGEDPIDKFIRLGEVGGELKAAADALTALGGGLATIMGADVEGILGDLADGMEEIFDVVDDMDEEVTSKLEAVGNSLGSMFAGLGEVLSGGLDFGALTEMATALPAMQVAISSMVTPPEEESGGFLSGIFGGGEDEEPKASPLEAFTSSMAGLGEAMSGIGEGADGFARFIESITSLQGLDLTSVAASLADVGWSILGFSFVISFMDDEDLEKLISVGTSMQDLFGSIGSVDLSGISDVFDSLTFIASDEFVTGMSAATDAIWEFIGALSVMSLLSGLAGLASIFGGGEKGQQEAQQTVPQPSVGAAATPSPESMIPPEEMLSPDEMGEFGGLSLESLGVEAANVVINMPAPVPGEPKELGGGNLEAKLDELINLMRSGGIAVNLDGKKVNRELATAIES
jgi:hypothetical protein